MTIKERNPMRPASSAKASTTKKPAESNRPYSISNTNMGGMSSQGDQIKAALDTLGIKLIKSEAERDVLKKLVEDTRSGQQRLERELQENRKELMETKRKLDDHRTETEGSRNRQERLEERLRESQANATKLTRKLEADEQKRSRLQRRMERLENIANEAQETLQSRAMVLLTDHSVAKASGMPMLPATGDMPALTAGQHTQPRIIGFDGDTHDTMPWWQRPIQLNTSFAAIALIIALGFGWAISTATQDNQQNAVAFLQDGSLAQIDLRTGTLKPLELSLTKLDSEETSIAEIETKTVSEEGQPLPQSKPETVIIAGEAPERDASLSDTLSELQDKAYAGVPEAQHDLAALYTAGSGVTQDYERASYWFTQAANAGVANAAYNLGVLYHQGLGVDQKIKMALDWYRQAALKGHPEAQYNLGIAYIEGIGTNYNPQLAAGFFQQAALSGITEAAYNLGLILENGLLAEPKPNQAMMWYRVGSEAGSVEARSALTQLAERLGLDVKKAGFLPDGTSLSTYVKKPEKMEPGATSPQKPAIDMQKIFPDLAEMIPDHNELIVAQIQEQLSRRDYYNGPEDGALSQKTLTGMKKYMKAANIEGNIKDDPETKNNVLLRLLQESTSGTITKA